MRRTMNSLKPRPVLSGVRARAGDPSAASDEALLAAMGLGERAAASQFVARFQARVFGLALAILGDSSLAEDVAQEALMRAWRNAGAYDARRGTVATWLLTITRNLAIDSLRLHRATPMDPGTMAGWEILSEEPGPAESALRAEAVRDVQGAVRLLPVDQRRALVLAAFYGRTAQEIATMEGVPLGTAKTRIRAGMQKLRTMLAEGTVAP